MVSLPISTVAQSSWQGLRPVTLTLCIEFARPWVWSLSVSFCLNFLLTCTFLFLVSAVKAISLIEQVLVINLFYLHVVQPHFFTDNSNKQSFYEEWDNYTSDTMTEGRETQVWCNSRGLEKWRCTIWCRGVQAWGDRKWGTGLTLERDFAAINNFPVIS